MQWSRSAGRQSMSQTDHVPAAPPPPQTWRRLAPPLLAVLAAVFFIVLATSRWDVWVGGRVVQSTNDAYIRAQTTRLSSRVAGAVKAVAANDFQHVKAGELLVQIDPADYDAQVAQAEAGVVGAQAALDNLSNQVELQYATIAQVEAQRVSALAVEVEAQQEQERQQSLTKTEAGTRQKFEQAIASYAKAQADVKASAASIAAQRHQLEVLAGTKKQRAADLLGAKAALDAAKLRLGYTTINAPFDGVVGERQVQPGDYVNIGSSLISVVPLPDVYVIANYKETQLTRVVPGQPVDVVVDTFPDQRLHGRVERISPASGSQFALLPPDNATGNFTKVVQRVPVRIALDKDQPLLARLLPGMSVTARIHVDEPAIAMRGDAAHGGK
jgi:membrane fusion protein (multidrug efflux system)